MKQLVLTLLLFVTAQAILSQGGVSISNTLLTPDASAMLDVTATDKGLLIPRVALTAINIGAPITAPANSLLVYNTATSGTFPNNVTPGFYYWDASIPAWSRIVTGNIIGSDDQNIDSLRLSGNILTAYIESGGSANVDLSTLLSSTTTYTFVRDSLLNDTYYLDSLVSLIGDSINTDNQNIDSLTLTGTILTTYIEDGASANIDLLNLASDSAFYTTIGDSLLADSLWLDSLSKLVNDNDWKINANGTGLEAAAANNNVASGTYAIAAGFSDTASGVYSVVSGGLNNKSTNAVSLVSGGQNNIASGIASTVGGGVGDTASGDYSLVSGGLNNKSTNAVSVVSGGENNIASGIASTVGGGQNNIAFGLASFVGGGVGDTASGNYSVVSGGLNNKSTNAVSSVSGGQNNIASGIASTVGGGVGDTASGDYSIVSGGTYNTAASYGEWVGGLYSSAYVPNSTSGWNANDRLFVVGNGTSAAARSNALTILKNGNVGIGITTPGVKLHLQSDDINYNVGLSDVVMESKFGAFSSVLAFYSGAKAEGAYPLTRDSMTSTIQSSGSTIRNLAFATGNIEQMRISASGYVGIGTVNPQTSLHLVSSDIIPMFVQNVSSDINQGSFQNTISLKDSNSVDFFFMGDASNSKTAGIYTHHDYGVSLSSFINTPIFSEQASVNVNRGLAPFEKSAITFRTKDIQRMIIDSIGNVGIGTINPTEKFEVVGNILASGTITPSDKRYKTNINTLNGALNNVLSLRGVTYNMKEEYKNKGFGEGLQIGVIAQEVEAIYPELIQTNEVTGYKGVDYSKFTPILIEAIKEQQALIEELRNENTALKSEKASNKSVNQLKAELNDIKQLLLQQGLTQNK